MRSGDVDALIDGLRAIAGIDGVLTEPHDIAPYRGDIGCVAPDISLIVVRPRSTEAVAGIVKVCVAAGISITPRGGGTGFCGGATPSGTGMNVVVSFDRMRKIRIVDGVNDVIVVEAGCTLREAQQAASASGRLLGLDHGGAGSSQIGGNLGTNAGGNNVLRYGMARDQVLGLEVVLADGRVLSRLSPLRKSNAGYDLKQLFVGGEGTLGLITAATLRLRPAVVKRVTACIGLRSPEGALALYALARSLVGESMSACELMSAEAVALHMAYSGDHRSPCAPETPWLLLVEIDSTSAYFDIDGAMQALIEAALERGIATDGTISASEAQRRDLWKIREGIAVAMVSTPGALKSDTAVPVSRIPEFIAQASRAVTSLVPGCRPAPFGHLGDGNIHFNVLPPEDMAGDHFGTLTGQLASAIAESSLTLGGTVSAEHGIGLTKRNELIRMMSAAEIELMRAVKRAYDPKGIFNSQTILCE
ncbi:MAG: FAD-binding oxidoreductase [Bradyrhizobium sp.]|nr:FAD-binding oxidoreductase [Bradyrhizobium sp.]